MRRLLNTLFVLSENGYLTVDGENVVVGRGKQEIGRIPMHTIESIRSFSYAGASPALMGPVRRGGLMYVSFLHGAVSWHESWEKNGEMYCCASSNTVLPMIRM